MDVCRSDTQSTPKIDILKGCYSVLYVLLRTEIVLLFFKEQLSSLNVLYFGNYDESSTCLYILPLF